ncbi:MAG: helix-turn-helix transcriptional regulator [Opitutales bacterium]|nr:helix-turn-helix transcriptional regulator [Opitutales bacterium]
MRISFLQSLPQRQIASIRDLEASEIYQLAGLSKSQFCALFSDSFGMSLQDYLLAERIKRSAALLKGSSLSITEIAYACGFISSSYFNRVFRQKMGCNPFLFRKHAQN